MILDSKYSTIAVLPAIILLPTILLAAPAVQASDLAYNLRTETLSRYITEGRDNLEEGGLYAISATAVLPRINVSLWYGESMKNQSPEFFDDRVSKNKLYQELSTTLELPFTLGNVESYIGYTHFAFIADSSHDDELSFGAAFTGWSGLTPAIDVVYSNDAKGEFVELSLTTELFTAQNILFEAYTAVAWDFGYASKRSDGLNNTQLGISLSYALCHHIQSELFATKSFAKKDIDKEEGRHTSWGGIAVSIEL